MSVSRTGGKPPRPTQAEALEAFRRALGPGGTLLIGPEAAATMTASSITLDGIFCAAHHFAAKPQIGSFTHYEGENKWGCYIVSVIPDDWGIRFEVLMDPVLTSGSSVDLISIKYPH